MIYPLIKAHQADFALRDLCSVLGVSVSGFYDWVKRKPSLRSQANAKLTEEIRRIHQASYESYGRNRIRAELRDAGQTVNHKRIAHLMQRAGIKGISRRRGYCVTTRRDQRQRPAPDLVQRQFVAAAPNQLWVADMTYIPTWSGFLYLAMVLDVFSRKVVGWAFGETMTADLVLAALNMAVVTRQPQAVIHHSDQGSQYTSLAFGKRCKEMGIQISMGSVGDAYDNAMAESFFASLECELINRHSWPTKRDARLAVFTWIEGWYNLRRRHSALNYQSPVKFEMHKQHASQSGLPTVCCAPVDNRTLVPVQRTPSCPQASTADNPAVMIHT
jgi:putative transposase